jgi:hypothetical protein
MSGVGGQDRGGSYVWTRTRGVLPTILLNMIARACILAGEEASEVGRHRWINAHTSSAPEAKTFPQVTGQAGDVIRRAGFRLDRVVGVW